MKKVGTYFFVLLISVVVFVLGFDYKIAEQPNTYYQVYLDNEYIGMIESKKELENYINSQADTIRENISNYKAKLEAIETYKEYTKDLDFSTIVDKVNHLILNKSEYNLTNLDLENLNMYVNDKLYNLSNYEINEMKDYVDKNNIYEYANEVFTPNGIEIKKVYTYKSDIISIQDIYEKIIRKKNCTVAGYKFVIKSNEEDTEDIQIYTIDKDTFTNAVEDLITVFVDEKKYEAYKNNSQQEITTVGSLIEKIYVDEDITYKAVNIPVGEKIYTNSKDLSSFLLRGDDFEESIVKVKSGESVETISFDNKISVQEFLIYNPKYTSRENLLVAGTDVVISKINPKVHVVVETYEVSDKETNYSTVEQYDEELSQGSIIVTQEGENGIERVSQNVKSVNGQISFVDPVGKETIKPSVSKIVNIGTKYIPSVGSISSWEWPTDSGYTISSYYGYRQYIFGSSWHSGIDIAGTGYGSNIYAANNGVITTRQWSDSYGWYIIINHNNGYYSLYGHMSRFSDNFSVGSTVERGQIIGYVGATGNVTGPHLHFEIRTCEYYSCTTNPLAFY